MRPYLARKRDTLDADSLPHSIASELAHRSEPEPQKAAAYADSLVVAASATVVPVLTAASWIGAQWHWLLYATLAPLAAVYFVIALFIWFSRLPTSSRFTALIASLATVVLVVRVYWPETELGRFLPKQLFERWLVILLGLLFAPHCLYVGAQFVVGSLRTFTARSAFRYGVRCSGLLLFTLAATSAQHHSFDSSLLLLPILAINHGLALAVAESYAHWCAVNPCNPLTTMRTWRDSWRRTLLNYHVCPLAVVLTWLVAPQRICPPLGTEISILTYLLVLCLCGTSLSFRRVAADRTRRSSPGQAMAAAREALTVWLSYNRHKTKAAGVFQLPRYAAIDDRCGLFIVVLALNVAGLISMFSLTEPGAPVSTTAEALAETESPQWSTMGDRIEGEVLFDDSRAELSWSGDAPDLFASVDQTKLKSDEPTRDESAPPLEPTTANTRHWGHTAVRAVVMLLTPYLLILTTIAAVAGPQLALYRDVLELESQSQIASDDHPDRPTIWDNRVERLINSAHAEEREYIYAGSSWGHDNPVLVHRDLYNAHAHIVGDSGSGKTALGLAPLMTQLVARADASHLIIDLKGDPQYFECARLEAERAGLPFKYFTTIPGCSSYVFNPFLQGHLQYRTLNQRVQNLLRSLSLDYGQEAYGRSYFSAMHETVLLNYLARYGRDIQSFCDLHRYVSDRNSYRSIGDMSEWTEARHLIALLNRVAAIEPLNVSPTSIAATSPLLQEAINMADLSRPDKRQVVYFFLPALEEAGTANAIAKLALFALLSAAARREAGRKNGRVYVYLDEFQVIVGSSAVTILEQARSMNVSLLLSHQHRGQLKTPDGDLTPAIEANTRFKQVFKATDADSMTRLKDESGEALYQQLGWELPYDASINDRDDDAFTYDRLHEQGWLQQSPIKTQESKGPRLEPNRIIELSAHPTASFFRVTQDQGYTRYRGYWTPLFAEYHIHPKEYALRELSPWPDSKEETLVVPLESEHDRRFGAAPNAAAGQGALFPDDSDEPMPPSTDPADEALRDRIRRLGATL